MTAWKNNIGRFLHESKAFGLSTHVSEGWLHTWRWLLQFITAESARPCRLLLTSSACMVWFSITFGTEILTTSIAPNSVHSHMLSSLHRNWLTLIVLLAHLHFTWNHFHHISTLTTNQTGAFLNESH